MRKKLLVSLLILSGGLLAATLVAATPSDLLIEGNSSDDVNYFEIWEFDPATPTPEWVGVTSYSTVAGGGLKGVLVKADDFNKKYALTYKQPPAGLFIGDLPSQGEALATGDMVVEVPAGSPVKVTILSTDQFPPYSNADTFLEYTFDPGRWFIRIKNTCWPLSHGGARRIWYLYNSNIVHHVDEFLLLIPCP